MTDQITVKQTESQMVDALQTLCATVGNHQAKLTDVKSQLQALTTSLTDLQYKIDELKFECNSLYMSL